MTKQPNPTFTRALELWFTYYQDRKKERYCMDGKSGMHLKQLLKKLETRLKDKGYEANEDQILNALAVFLLSITDKWILDNLEISIVNSKYNVIISKAAASSPFVNSQKISEIIQGRSYGDFQKHTGT